MNNLLGRLRVLGVTAVLASCALGGCSGSEVEKQGNAAKGEKQGTVGLLLRPVAGLTVTQVHYTVSKGATLVGEGDLPTPGTAASFSFGLSLPVGTGYTLALSAVTAESADITCSGIFGPFNVTANSSTDMSLVLTCIDRKNGALNAAVDVLTDACPRLAVNYAVATPSSGFIGETPMGVLSAATDLDGRPLTFVWSVASPGAGSFASPAARDTTFACTANAETRLTVTVSNGQCQKSLSTRITCLSRECGDGVLSPGEDCDPTLEPCPADCTVQCGDGVAEAPLEDCDPPVVGFCSSTCRQKIPECGDGGLQPGEQCDDGNVIELDGCSTSCIIVDPPFEVCGDGVVTPPAEECDPPFVDGCGADCRFFSSAACNSCVATNCQGAENCASVPDSVQCNKTLDCVRDSGCADSGFALFCYCGAVTATACDTAGGAKGACKAEIEVGLGSTDPIVIQNNLFDTTLSAGKAMARVDCELGANCTSCF